MDDELLKEKLDALKTEIEYNYELIEQKVDNNNTLINEKFNNLSSNFDNLGDEIKSINDNISKLRNDLKADMEKEVKHKIELEASSIQHAVDTSINEIKNNSNIKKLLGDKLDDAIYFVRHPQAFVFMVIAMFMLALSPYVVPLIKAGVDKKNEDRKIETNSIKSETKTSNLEYYMGYDSLAQKKLVAKKK